MRICVNVGWVLYGEVQVCAPSRVAAVIFGSPSIVRHAVLSNRLHVLIKFCTGELALWDITRCRPIQRCTYDVIGPERKD